MRHTSQASKSTSLMYAKPFFPPLNVSAGFYNSMSAGFMPGQQSMSFVDMQPPSPHAGYFEMQQQLLWMQQNQQNLQQLLQVQQELHKLRLEQQNNFKLKPEQPGVHDSAGLEMPQKEISPPMLAPSVPGPDNPQESEGPARTPSE